MINYKNTDLDYIKFNNNTFYVKWCITRWCNFNCAFCNFKKDNFLFSQDEINEQAIILNNLLSDKIKKDFKLKFIGGEPCVYDLTQILDRFTISIKSISIVTNFYRELDYYKDLYLYCNKKHIEFLLSCSWHDQNKKFDSKFYELTDWCRENNLKDPGVIFVLRNESDCKLIEKYKKDNIKRISILLERDKYGKVINRPDMIKYFNDFNSNKLNLRTGKYSVSINHKEVICNSLSWLTNLLEEGGFVTEGRLCDAGINSIVINPDGKIYRDSCRYLYENDDLLIGNINEKVLNLPTEPLICRINTYKNNKDVRCILCNDHGFDKIIDYDSYNKVIEGK